MSTRTRQAPQRRLRLCFLVAIGVSIAATFVGDAKAGASISPYGPLPLFFEANEGQIGNTASFLARAPGHTLYVVPDGVTLLPSSQEAGVRPVTIRFPGTNTESAAEGIEMLPGRINYYRGADPNDWHEGIPTFAKVRKRGIYPGIDFVVYGNGRDFEFDFVIAPGADPAQIRFQADGAQSVELAPNGDLVLTTEAGEIRQKAPFAYQRDGEGLRPVEARYEMLAENRIGFRLGGYDPNRELVIDPVLEYAAAIGSHGDGIARSDRPRDIAVDADGAAYIVGRADGRDFPFTSGTPSALGFSMYLTKIAPDGLTLEYSVFVDRQFGTRIEALGLAVDGDNNAYVVGETTGTIPVTANAFDTSCGSCLDTTRGSAFLLKFDSTGLISYGTYLEGDNQSDNDAHDVAVDLAGDAYIVGITREGRPDLDDNPNFPVSAGAVQETYGGDFDLFVFRLRPAGAGTADRIYATYLGGAATEREFPPAIALEPGCASDCSTYVGGTTRSQDFPTTPDAIDDTLQANHRAATVSKLSPDGSTLEYSTLVLRGEISSALFDLDVDAQGQVHAGGWRTGVGNGTRTFVFKLDSAGANELYATQLSDVIQVTGIALDALGNAHVVGPTSSPDFVAVDPIQPNNASHLNQELFILTLDPTGTTRSFGTTYGGSGSEYREFGPTPAIALHADDSLATLSRYVTGVTRSPDFPVTPFDCPTAEPPGVYDGCVEPDDDGGVNDVYVLKIGPDVVSNRAPIASDDAYSTDEDTTLSVVPILLGVLGNDNDPDNDVLSAVAVDNPTNGVLTLNPDGSFEYTPDANFHGADSFTYKANDGEFDSNAATVVLTVNPINDAPVAQADGPFSGVAAQPITMDASASFDVDGDTLTYLWDFGDGTMLNTADASVSHTYAGGGVFDVTLTVNDSDLTSAPFATQAEVAADGGGGQRSDVDAFLALISPAASPVEVPAGTTSIEVRIAYGETILPGTFAATLNGQALGGFTPAAGSAETVVIPIDPADSRTVLLLQVDGLRTDGKVATDRDRILIRAP